MNGIINTILALSIVFIIRENFLFVHSLLKINY